ncbi:MAG: ATP-binding domain-containing protein [Pleurocapsa minor HA4230-MV1]|jgi:superfamily I DNA and RNA helicase|nr:ATP-binding domain-containing protein [Pleurocapsa minor HA4230-MV1]
MPVGINEKGRKFIETEPIGQDGEHCEQKAWDACKKAFADRECIGYWRYPIFSKTGECRKEPDILIVDKEFGIVVTEVKGITINQIKSVNGHLWEFQNFYTTQDSPSPYKQAEKQLYSLLGYCDREEIICRQVKGRAIVALPFISEKEWQEKGFDRLPSCPPIIFKEDLGAKSLIKRIEQSSLVQSGRNLNDEQWELLLAVVGGTPVLRRTLNKSITVAQDNKTRSSVINQLRERLYELDLQQQHIGLEIPPGAQRIRGIAGSGKTVLLCQKAANMYLKHPDWNIALVFFTRSLYDQIENLVDKWIRHYSYGELDYKSNVQAQSKLKILHAWGARDRAGFYRTICKEHNQHPLAAIKNTQPNEGLATVCKQLMQNIDITPMFDAVLIDEGQDLVADPIQLRYEDKQAIYWMAYQSLRPCDRSQPEQKRLIWAYDEAQSLDTLKIPTAKELFGEELSQLLSRGRQYKGGINKSEVMHRCYRTPGEILTAAHAIGMGLLRPNGILSGLTTKTEWESIGYEVQGAFREGQEITLHRPPANSPNPIPTLWGEPVIQFNTYSSRQEEFSILAENIKHNLEYDGLTPSRQILVLVLGGYEAKQLETHVAEFLMNQGIDIFIPSAVKLNQLDPKFDKYNPNNYNPDTFWHEGGVTVSRLNRAKGNEADMVYVVGCDNVAKNESNINLRNQLFVALSRARGWVSLSGTGYYPMYDEIQKVINSGDTFTFNYQRPKRSFDDEITEIPVQANVNIQMLPEKTSRAYSRAANRAKYKASKLKLNNTKQIF